MTGVQTCALPIYCGQINPSEWAQKDAQRGLTVAGIAFVVIALLWTAFIMTCADAIG